MKQFNVNDQKWSELKCDQVAECFTGLHKDSYVELWTCEEETVAHLYSLLKKKADEDFIQFVDEQENESLDDE